MIVTVAMPAELRADAPTRRIYGRALPYGVAATTSTGQTIKWQPGSIDLSGAPVVLFHDESKPIGRVDRIKDNPDGQDVEIAVSATPAGDEALTLAGDEVLTGLSVGADLKEFTEDEDGVLDVTAADRRHLAVVVSAAYQEARVTKVAAQAAEEGAPPMAETATTPTPEAVPAAPRQVSPTVLATAPSPGEYLFAMVKRREDPARWERMQAAVLAAAPHTLWDDVKGGTYNPLLGPVVDSFAPAERPVATAFGVRQAPSGVKAFLRPSITEKLDAAVTAAEKTDVTDGPLKVEQATITMSFLKRSANISAEALAFTSIDVLNLVANDLVRAYLHGFEAATVAALIAQATGTPVTIAAGGADAVDKLAGAAAAIYQQTYTMPDTLVCAPDVWAKFTSYKGTDGRPLFPTLGPVNAPGQNSAGVTSISGLSVLGLRPVVSWSVAAGKAYLASSQWVEVYESSRIDMRVDEPLILGVALGIGGAHGQWNANGKSVVPITVS